MKDIALLVSYQDTEVHKGTIYKADNWVAANTSKGMKWDTEQRQRNEEQSLADKVRWEYKLREFIEHDDTMVLPIQQVSNIQLFEAS